MTATGVKNVHIMDTATMVIATMRKHGISALPRNYELVYEVLNASNAALTREFDAIGGRPTQEQLDIIGKKYFAHHHRTGVVEVAHSRISGELEGMLRLLKQEQSSLESYSKLLGETYSRISVKSASSAEILAGVINVLSSATGDTMEKGKVVATHMVERAREMEQVKLELDEYKRIANTDTLTRLSNRRAFDEVLSGIYNDKRNTMYYALIVADIDHFKKFNDTYGHPVGDRVLGVVAAVMKSTLRKDIFVARTGGEEFAVILQGTSLDITCEIAERIRRSIEATPLKNQKSGLDYGPITMSLGICMATEASTPEELYNKADVALYAAKNSGRNRVEIYRPEIDTDLEKSWTLYKK